jgi:predicted translin family RNA/ssDNA-binding protein
MEAISFQHYLRHQSLITFEEASNSVPAGVELTVDDYVLGIFDLVGELMRYAITTIATTGALPTAKSSGADQQETVLTDLLLLRTQFEILSTSSCAGGVLDRDYNKKMEVMKTCCEKVERAVYEMVVRGKERPKGWVPDAPEERAPAESY